MTTRGWTSGQMLQPSHTPGSQAPPGNRPPISSCLRAGACPERSRGVLSYLESWWLKLMDRPLVNPGRLFWTGQHWMVYLRTPGSEEDTGRVSVWHTHFCEAGEGTVIYVDIPGTYQAACTDNREVAEFIDRWVRDMPGPYQTDHVVDSNIRREGDIRSDPSTSTLTCSSREAQSHSTGARWRASPTSGTYGNRVSAVIGVPA